MSIRQIKSEFRDTAISLGVTISLWAVVSVVFSFVGNPNIAVGPICFAAIIAFSGVIRLVSLFGSACELYIQAERRAQAFGADPNENLEDIDCG